MDNIKRWYENYIKDINLEKMEWIKLNANQLYIFLKNNYLDKEVWEYVLDEKANRLYPIILGMNYLNINMPLNNRDDIFLLGIVENNIGKKTILAATIYSDKSIIFSDQEKPITYIYTMEVNSYFRNKGLYKRMCEALINFINSNQHIVVTKQTEMGLKYNVLNILKEILIRKGFQKCIFEDNYSMINEELHNMICSKSK